METLETRLSEVARIAVRLEQETGCPAQLMIAQWAIESAWGAKPVGHANYFGIKKAARHDMCCTFTTREVINGASKIMDLEFADYTSLLDSCNDYVWLITQGSLYKEAWAQYQVTHDLRSLIAAVAAAYATDPHYATMVSLVAYEKNVAEAIMAARQEASRAV